MLTDFCTWAIWAEIVQQCPGSRRAFCRSPVSMKEASTVEPMRHGIHVSSQHIAGTMGLRMIICQGEAIHLGIQFEHCLKNITGHIFLCPLAQVCCFGTKRCSIFRTINVPYPLGNLVKDIFQVPTTLPDFEEGMQKALNDDDQGEQAQPSSLRGSPTIGIDRLWGISGFHLLSFLLEMVISFRHILSSRTERNRSSQNTILPDCGCYNHFFTLQPGDFFVGQQVQWQFL